MDKTALRKHLLKKRHLLENRGEKQQKITEYLNNFLTELSPKIIGIYSAINGEVELKLPINQFHLSMPTTKNNELIFKKWYPGDPLITGRFGILQPPEHNETIMPDTLIVPCLGMDNLGYRLGYGRGYYDRFLSKNPDIFTIGVIFSDQLVEKIPIEPYDIPLRAICDENGVRVAGR